MEIGVIFDEIGPGIIDWLPFLEKHEVKTGGEIRTIDGVPIHTLTLHQAETYAKVLRDAGIKVTALASGLGKRDLLGPDGKLSLDVVEQERGKAAHLMRLAEMFWTDGVRAFGGFRQKDMTAMWPHVVEFFKRLLEGVSNGCRLLIENEPATGLSRPSHVLALREALGKDERIAALVDVGNIIFDVELVGALGMLSNPPDEAVNLLNRLIQQELVGCGGIIALVHLKNLAIEPSGMQARTVPLDKGLVDFQKVLGTLHEINPKLCLDLETHRLPEGQDLSEAQRHSPGGEGYGNPNDVAYDLGVARKMLTGVKGLLD